MPPLYPKMRERPEEIRLNQASPLFDGFVAGAFGSIAFSRYGKYSLRPINYPANTPPITFLPAISRFCYEGPASVTNAYLATYVYIYLYPPITTMCYVYQRSYRYRTRPIELGTSRWLHAPQLNRRADGQISTYWANTSGDNYSAVDSAGGIVTTYQWYQVGCRYMPGANVYVNAKSVTGIAGVSGTPVTTNTFTLIVGNQSFDGYVADAMLWDKALPLSVLEYLADMSNIDLRVANIPLLLPPRRRLWPVSAVHEAVYLKRRNLGLRAGSREVVI